jgi:hypothetical protein
MPSPSPFVHCRFVRNPLWDCPVTEIGCQPLHDNHDDNCETSYTQKLWMGLMKKAAYLPG